MNSNRKAKLMLLRATLAAALAIIIATAYAPSAHAFGGAGGVGGVGGVGGMGGMGGMGGIGAIGAAGVHGNPAGGFVGVNGGQLGGIGVMAVPNLAVQEMRELKLAGQVPANPDRLPSGARIVQLRVNGQMVPMALDSELGGSDLEFNPGNRKAEDLYHALLTKQVAVIGDEKLRNQIVQAASENGTQALEIQGYVFNQTTPYFVVKSVEAAK
jgi:hypothetical protein